MKSTIIKSTMTVEVVQQGNTSLVTVRTTRGLTRKVRANETINHIVNHIDDTIELQSLSPSGSLRGRITIKDDVLVIEEKWGNEKYISLRPDTSKSRQQFTSPIANMFDEIYRDILKGAKA